jgi:hypothetical protein
MNGFFFVISANICYYRCYYIVIDVNIDRAIIISQTFNSLRFMFTVD